MHVVVALSAVGTVLTDIELEALGHCWRCPVSQVGHRVATKAGQGDSHGAVRQDVTME